MQRLPGHTEPGKAPLVFVRMPRQTIDRLDAAAERCGMRRSQYLRALVDAALADAARAREEVDATR
jgi:hypothetical protein